MANYEADLSLILNVSKIFIDKIFKKLLSQSMYLNVQSLKWASILVRLVAFERQSQKNTKVSLKFIIDHLAKENEIF